MFNQVGCRHGQWAFLAFWCASFCLVNDSIHAEHEWTWTWYMVTVNSECFFPTSPWRKPCSPPGISLCTNRASVMWKPKSKPKRGGEHKDTKFHCLVEKDWKGRCGIAEVERAAILSWGRNRCILTIHICKGSMPVFLWVNASCAHFAFFGSALKACRSRSVFSTSGSPKAALTKASPCAPGFGFLRVLGSHEPISIYLMLTSEAAEIQDIVNNFVENWQTGRQSCKLQSQGPCDVQLCALRSFSPCARPLHGTVGFLKFSNCFASRGKSSEKSFSF